MTASNRPGSFPRIRRTFLAGLLAALPLALTITVIVWLVEYIQLFLGPNSAFGQFMESFGLKFVSSEISAYFLGIISVLLIIYLLGVFVEAGMKNRWQALIDGILNRVPLVRKVYNAINKLVLMFDTKDQADIKSMGAVMCFFGGRGGGTGVLALLTSPEKINQHGVDYYSIMIPTAPVPFGGAILFVPVDWVEHVDIGFDGLLNIYMSMGITSPDYFNQHKTGASERAN